MLAKAFLEHKNLFNAFKTFTSKIEILSYIHTCVVFENDEFIIKINIEENEMYVSVVSERKKDKRIFYALSDYSFLENASDMFDFIKSIDKKEYYQEIKDCLRQKTNKNNFKEIHLISLIYRLLEAFLLEIGDNGTVERMTR